MNLISRLNRIDRQISIYVAEQIPAEVTALAARILNPSDDDWAVACDSIAETMPEKYQQVLEDDLKRLDDLNISATSWNRLDHYSAIPQNRTGKPHPKPLTQRFFELVDLRMYQCPRPLALPEAFCRAMTELEPLQWLTFGGPDPGWTHFSGMDCEDCLLKHPSLGWHEDRRCAHRQLFDRCVLCGGVVRWLGVKADNSRPCHVSEGSPYQIAMAQLSGDEDADQN
jgi:hypothetical protein